MPGDERRQRHGLLARALLHRRADWGIFLALRLPLDYVMTPYTTLNRIREHSPCEGGWKKLLRHLGKTQADDELVPFATIVESNGMDDALWCCRTVAYDSAWRMYAVWCARQVQHLMKDKRSLDALDVAQAYASGMATRDQLERAWAAAWAAAAREAAEAAAWAAAWATAAAREAAEAAAGAAAREAAEAAQKAMFLRVVNAESEDAAVVLLIEAMPKVTP